MFNRVKVGDQVSVEDGWVDGVKFSSKRILGRVVGIEKGPNFRKDPYDAMYLIQTEDGEYGYDFYSIAPS